MIPPEEWNYAKNHQLLDKDSVQKSSSMVTIPGSTNLRDLILK
jgi:hypothetical protein